MHKNLSSTVETIAAELVKKATEAGVSIATAESCTGGMLSSAITNISGSSKVFSYGFITYANEAKTKILSVSEDTLKQHGAVSEATAAAMASGALNVANADIAVSITGIAGPTGATADKPIGLVYIAISQKKGTIVKQFLFTGDRHQIRLQAVLEALTLLLDGGM